MQTDTHDSRKSSDDNENLVHDSLQFADSLKDLRSLRKQLYTAAEHFELSYNRNDHKQIVVQLSKDYVAGALVSTVEHLGSVADKLDKFLDEKANQFSATIQTFYCIQQRLSTIEEMVELRRMSQQMSMAEAIRHKKHYILPASETSPLHNSEPAFRHFIFSPPHNEKKTKGDISLPKEFQRTRKKALDPLPRKQPSRMMMNTSQSSVPHSFSFTKVPEQNKTKKRSISPFRFSLNPSGPDSKRSVSPSPSVSKTRCSSEPRRAISACRRRQDEDATNRDKETETYTSRSKQLFRALISIHRPGK